MEAERKIQDLASSAKRSYPEVDNIRNDLRALKSDTAQLGQHVVSDSREKLSSLAESATEMAKEEYTHLSKTAKEESRRLEAYIKERPFQGVAAAFLTGVVISMMMRKH